MMNNKQKLTDSTVALINKIRDKNLLNYITTYIENILLDI